MSDLSQHVLEPILVEEAGKVGAQFRFYTEFASFREESYCIKTTVRECSCEREYEIASRYLIGADGARSAVLDSLGIPVDGIQLNSAFNAH